MDDIESFFEKERALLPLFYALTDELLPLYPDTEIVVQKSCIAFRDPSPFCYVSLPLRRVRDWPERCFIVTFGLLARENHPRIAQSVEPYPGRWTHHVPVTQRSDIDAQLLGWLRQAYAIKQVTGRTKRRRQEAT